MAFIEIMKFYMSRYRVVDFSFLEIPAILFFQNNSTLFIDFLCKFLCKMYTKI